MMGSESLAVAVAVVIIFDDVYIEIQESQNLEMRNGTAAVYIQLYVLILFLVGNQTYLL